MAFRKFEELPAWQAAIELAVRVFDLAHEGTFRGHPGLRDQIERAASSIVLNLAEGDRRRGRDPGRFFDMAHGSAGEIRGALDLADAWGWQVESGQARALLDRELGLLWGLTRRARSGEAASTALARAARP